MAGWIAQPVVNSGEPPPSDWRARGQAEVLTIRDVAAYLHLPLSTVYRLVGRGALPGLKMGRQWRFHKAALDEWLRHTPGRPDGWT
jgi:excisionase family DNA binding protein